MANYLRQHRIFDPNKNNKPVHVIGAGGIGSNLVLQLAKMGVDKISVYDGDVIEGHNQPNQLYGKKHIGMKKVDALATIIKTLCDVEIQRFDRFVQPDDDLNLGDGILIFALDNLEIRQKLYKKFKNYPNWLIDGRMGGEQYAFYALQLNDKKQCAEYEEQLYVTGSDDPCGMKAIIYTLFSLTSEMCNVVKKINMGQKVTKYVQRFMGNYRVIGGTWIESEGEKQK